MAYDLPQGKWTPNSSPDGPMHLSGMPKFNRPSNNVEPDDFVASRMVQGEVTQNRTFKNDIYEARTSEDITSDPKMRMGVVTDKKQLWFKEGDLLLAPAMKRSLNGNLLTKKNVPAHLAAGDVFATLRGLFITPHDSANHSRWSRSFVFAGFSKANVMVGDVFDTTSAAAVGGGMSIPVNGSEQLEMGRILRYKIPSTDANERLAEERKHKSLGVAVDVLRPIIESEKAEDMLDLPAQYLDEYLRETSRSRQLQILAGHTEQSSQADNSLKDGYRFFHTEYAHGSAVDFLLYLTLAARMGLVTLNTPKQDENGAIASLAALQGVTLDSLMANNGAYSAMTGGLLRPINDGVAAITRKRELWGQVRVLAGMLDLLKVDDVPAVPSLRDMLLRTRLRGLMTRQEHQQHRTAADILQTVGYASESANEADRALSRLQLNRSHQAAHAFYRLYYNLGRQRIGRTISAGLPGREVDIIF